MSGAKENKTRLQLTPANFLTTHGAFFSVSSIPIPLPSTEEGSIGPRGEALVMMRGIAAKLPKSSRLSENQAKQGEYNPKIKERESSSRSYNQQKARVQKTKTRNTLDQSIAPNNRDRDWPLCIPGFPAEQHRANTR